MAPRHIGPQPGPQTTFSATPADIAIYGGSAGGGKLLPLRTLIATPTGWTTMGELKPGDQVLSDEGLPTSVTFCSAVEPAPDAWELEFDDGTRIVADADHQWVTLTDEERLRRLRQTPEWRAARQARRPRRGTGKRPDLVARNAQTAALSVAVVSERGSVRTTREICETLLDERARVNHCIVNPAPLVLPHADLVVDPYVLGAWLGDGTSRDGSFTCNDSELIESIRSRGYVVSRVPSSQHGYTIRALQGPLRTLGVLNNKHIPQPYLRGSIMQRLALLQGLCDTDGYAAPAKGSVEFTTTSPALRDGVMELLATLGIKPSCRAGLAKLNGRVTGPKWRIQFWTELPAFELPRKLAQQKRTLGTRRHRRYIVAARPVPPEPMRCISVDAPSRCYLAGREMIVTHNTWSLAYEAGRYAREPGYAGVLFRRTSPELTGGGSVWAEARRIYPHLGGEPRESPTLDWRFPSGGLIEFRHAQHERSVDAHQSKQYQYIGMDELTQFASYQFWFLLSRLRGGSIPKRLRGTCNPDPDSFVRSLIDWYIGEDGLAIESRSGVIRWFTRLDEKLVWGKTPDDVTRHDPRRIRRRGEPPASLTDARPEPMSFTFVRARVSDNQVLLASDPGYMARLNMLPGALAKRMRDGNWNARDSAGDYFDRSWCPMVDHVETRNIVRRVRFWDKAATSPSPANPDPDWTRGSLLWELDSGDWVFADLQSLRAGPAEVDRLMLQTAQMDRIETEQGAWVDPGQAGKVDDVHMQDVLLGYAYQGIPARESKETYASIWTGLAKKGRLIILRRDWNAEAFYELEGFPLRNKKDIMDSLSGAFFKMIGPTFTVGYDASDDPRHPGRARDDDDDDDSDDDDGASYSRGAYF